MSDNSEVSGQHGDGWKLLAESLTEDTLRARLKSNEHDFVERKPKSRQGEWRQAAVAFANSAPIGWPAVLFVGLSDDGTPQCQTADETEKLIRSVADSLDGAYPAIYRHIVPIDIPNEGKCVAVVIPGSPMRPHFAGQSYVRVGDQTKVASEDQFASLVASHNAKVREILKWTDREVTWITIADAGPFGRREGTATATITVVSCNAHYATFREQPTAGGGSYLKSQPLNNLELGYDHDRDRLIVYYYSGR